MTTVSRQHGQPPSPDSPKMAMREWYIAKVKKGMDRELERFFTDREIPVYAPKITVPKKGKQQLESLFPGYLFVHADPTESTWPVIRWARGLSYFLPSTSAPEALLESTVSEISDRVAHWNNGGWVQAFEPGDRVIIGAGPLQNIEALFQRYLPAQQRCEVLVTLFGGPRCVGLTLDSIRNTVMTQRFSQRVSS